MACSSDLTSRRRFLRFLAASPVFPSLHLPAGWAERLAELHAIDDEPRPVALVAFPQGHNRSILS